MALSQEQLMRLLAGVDLPNSDAVYGMDQQQDPASQYMQAYGSDYMDPAMQSFEAASGTAQDPKYWNDDILARQKFYAGLAQDQAKVGYDVSRDRSADQIKQANLSMDEATFADEHGDPTAQLRFLMSKGYNPQTIVDAYEAPTDPADFEAQMKRIDDDLGETDKFGQPLTVHSPGGLTNRHRLYEEAKRLATQQSDEEKGTLMSERWKGLGMQQRAKEIYLRQQNPTKNVAVGRRGDVFYGDDAEHLAQQADTKKVAPRGTKMSYAEWDKQTRKKGQDERLQSKGVRNPGTVLQTSMPSMVGSGIRWGA